MVTALGGGFPPSFPPGGPPDPVSKRRCHGGADGASDTAPTSKRWRFPLRAAATASGLALTGDAAAQLVTAWNGRENHPSSSPADNNNDEWRYHHDWVRSLRMASYGFAVYGPMSQVWYEFLDTALPAKTPTNFMLKVGLNQVVLGPAVIAAVFAWNHLWLNQLSELPDKYRRLMLPTLVAGWKFWVPAAALNFGVVPLQARVGFMSTCSVFWNFYLSTRAMSK